MQVFIINRTGTQAVHKIRTAGQCRAILADSSKPSDRFFSDMFRSQKNASSSRSECNQCATDKSHVMRQGEPVDPTIAASIAKSFCLSKQVMSNIAVCQKNTTRRSCRPGGVLNKCQVVRVGVKVCVPAGSRPESVGIQRKRRPSSGGPQTF